MIELESKKIKLVVVNQCKLYREGLISLLSHHEDIEICGEYDDGAEFVWSIMQSTIEPDVALVYLNLPGNNGIEVCQQIQKYNNNLKVILISKVEDPLMVRSAYFYGASSFLLDHVSSEEVHKAIHAIIKGGIYYNDIYTPERIRKFENLLLKPRRNEIYPKFSVREKEIINLICQEYTNIEIANILKVRKGTIDKAKHRIMEKMNVKSSVGVTKFAIQNGLIK